jgi:hypothetical protein
MTATEPTLTRIALDDTVFQNIYDAETEFGILHTSYLYRYLGALLVPRFLLKTRSGNGPGSTKRIFFWRHVIRRGTDLSSLGVLASFPINRMLQTRRYGEGMIRIYCGVIQSRRFRPPPPTPCRRPFHLSMDHLFAWPTLW